MNPWQKQLREKAFDAFQQHFPQTEESFKARSVKGLNGVTLAYWLLAKLRKKKECLFVLLPSHSEQDRLYNDLSALCLDGEEIIYYPETEVPPYEDLYASIPNVSQRVKSAHYLLQNRASIILATVRSVLPRVMPPETFEKAVINLRVGDEINYKSFIQTLNEFGYTQTSQVRQGGEISVRGEIIDIFTSQRRLPVRLELFDTEIESLREFNPASQISVKKIEKLEILPKRQSWLEEERVAPVLKGLQQRFGESELFRQFHERVSQQVFIAGVQNYLPFFYDTNLPGILDYIKKPENIHFFNRLSIKKMGESAFAEVEEIYRRKLKKDAFRASPEDLYISPEKLFNQFAPAEKTCDLISISQSSKNMPDNFPALLSVDAYGSLQAFETRLKDNEARGIHSYVCADFPEQVKRLNQLFRADERTMLLADWAEASADGKSHFVEWNLSQGFFFPEQQVQVICEHEIFGRKKKINKKFSFEDPGRVIESFVDINEGDYVVHINHGIGVYRGLKRMTVSEKEKDFLKIEYAGKSNLFIPVEQVNLIQKYIGAKGSVKMDQLGGKAWEKVKNRAKKDVEAIAKDLVKIYALRKQLKKSPFPPDTYWQADFEAEFPYEETPDQLKAIDDIKNDMESDRPMDRLVCGDVGFGKTEVAIRAVFKAVMSGKQALVLVPTTILSEQHYQNFKKRFKNFPVEIAGINRFRTTKEQNEIITRLKSGQIDVVIGTHRLLNKSIVFKDLGLLVVDEEQKFGVRQKEKIRERFKLIDTLTLTATPIPRTLHMSLVRIRDISIINTPPLDRHPVETWVSEFDEEMLTQGIRKELERGGQVYFVHNRIETITQVANIIGQLVPEANIAVAHGQMEEQVLEEVMKEFIEGEKNLLLSTAIVDSGLDIPNANTIFVNNAEMFGLSQLYQLRGRVGRSTRQAYAYMLYRKNRVLSEEAMKRLQSISELVSLGSGLKIAMKDLEIRGAGNILGEAQSGSIMAVGFELYTQLLEEAVADISEEEKEKSRSHFEALLDIKYSGFIPDSYVPHNKEKIAVYRRIASIRSKEEYLAVLEELDDRFGKTPKVIEELFKISELRILAQELKIPAIVEKVMEVEIRFDPKSLIQTSSLLNMIQHQQFPLKPSLQDQNIVVLDLKPYLSEQKEKISLDEKLEIVQNFLKAIS